MRDETKTMKKKQDEFQVTIGYTAVITMSVRAKNREEAQQIAESQFKQDKFQCKNLLVEGDTWSVEGITNITKTWGKI